jgi:hypothetical protein
LDKKPRKIQPQFSVAARLSGLHARILAAISGARPSVARKIEGES